MEFPLGSLSLGAGEASMVNGSTVRLAGSCQGVTRHQHQAPAPDTKELSGGHQEAAGTKSQRVTRHKEAGGHQMGNTKNLSWGSPYAQQCQHQLWVANGHKMPLKIVAILVKGHKNIFRIGLIKRIKLQIEWCQKIFKSRFQHFWGIM